jgi:replicative DNA helicase
MRSARVYTLADVSTGAFQSGDGGFGGGGKRGFSPRPIIQLSDMFDRQPPQAVDMEKNLLGSMLVDPIKIAEVAMILGETGEAFYIEAHGLIYQGLVALADRNNNASDVALLAEELQSTGKLESVGGKDYLFELGRDAVTPAFAVNYARIIADKFRLRKLVEHCSQSIYDVYQAGHATGEEARQVIDKAEQRIFELAQAEKAVDTYSHELSGLIMEEYQRLLSLDGKPASTIKTGFDDLDKDLGGLEGGQMVIIAARPAMGKTAFALNIAEQIALGTNTPRSIRPAIGRKQTPVAFFSLEMSAGQLCQRLLSGWTGISSNALRSGQLKKADYSNLLAAAEDLREAPLYIDDSPGLTTMGLRARARRLKKKHDIGCIVIDYLQLLTSPMHARESRQVEVSSISRSIKELARELDVPILALSQLNRGPEGRDGNKPRLSDLRESGSLEQDADMVLMLHREEYYHIQDPNWIQENPEKEGLAEVIIAKQRNGPTGTVELQYVHHEMRFKNRADHVRGMPGGMPGGPSGGAGLGARGTAREMPRAGGGGFAESKPIAQTTQSGVGNVMASAAGQPGSGARAGASSFSSTIRPKGIPENHRDGGGPDGGAEVDRSSSSSLGSSGSAGPSGHDGIDPEYLEDAPF